MKVFKLILLAGCLVYAYHNFRPEVEAIAGHASVVASWADAEIMKLLNR